MDGQGKLPTNYHTILGKPNTNPQLLDAEGLQFDLVGHGWTWDISREVRPN
jgi:hypothetical protein